MKIITHVFLAVFTFIIGAYYGYEKGAINQIYLNAPAEIYLINEVINQNEANNYAKSKLSMAQGDIINFKSSSNLFLAKHPIHTEALELYNKYNNK